MDRRTLPARRLIRDVSELSLDAPTPCRNDAGVNAASAPSRPTHADTPPSGVDIVLVKTAPEVIVQGGWYRMPLLGLGYLAAYVRERGASVAIVDAMFDRLTLDETVERIVAARPRLDLDFRKAVVKTDEVFTITGTLDNPKVRPDAKALLGQAAQGAKREVTEKATDAIRGLLKKKKQ